MSKEDLTLSNKDIEGNSRRRVLQGGLGLIAAAAGAATTTRQARAQEKLAQAVVQYQDTPKDGAKCSACTNFAPPAACNIVEGKISPEGWCVAFAPKS